MKYSIIICLAIFTAVSATEHPYKGEISSMLDMLYRTEYDSAMAIADSVEAQSPVTGRYMKMSLLNTYMSDYETDTLEHEFYEHYEYVIKQRNSQDPFTLYYVGGAYFQKSSYLAMRGNYTGALQHGLKAISYFNRVIEKDSTIYDAYLGRGLTGYFRKFIPGMGGRADEAKSEILRAAEKGLFSRVPAYDMLAIIYTMEEKFDSALSYSDILTNMYPDNRMFLFTRVKVLLAAGKYNECISELDVLEKNIIDNQPFTFYNHASVFYYKALCYHETAKSDMALEYIDKVLSLSVFMSNDNRINEYVNKARALEKEIR